MFAELEEFTITDVVGGTRHTVVFATAKEKGEIAIKILASGYAGQVLVIVERDYDEAVLVKRVSKEEAEKEFGLDFVQRSF